MTQGERVVYDVLPLRAVIFQFLFLLVAIAIEAAVLHRFLKLDYKISVRYSATINLLSTFLGWLIFFNAQPFLPEALRVQLMSYVFFEQFFPGVGITSIPPVLIVLGFGIFLGTFFVELIGLDYLEVFLDDAAKPKEADEQASSFRFRKHNPESLEFESTRAYSLLVANSLSFSAILILLVVRWLEQSRYVSL